MILDPTRSLAGYTIDTLESSFQKRQPIRRVPIRLSLSSIRPSIGTKNPIPEEMDHREIAVRVPVMNEMQFLFPSEPCESLNHEEIDWQYEVCTRSYQKHRNEEEGRIVAFVTEVRR